MRLFVYVHDSDYILAFRKGGISVFCISTLFVANNTTIHRVICRSPAESGEKLLRVFRFRRPFIILRLWFSNWIKGRSVHRSDWKLQPITEMPVGNLSCHLFKLFTKKCVASNHKQNMPQITHLKSTKAVRPYAFTTSFIIIYLYLQRFPPLFSLIFQL